MSYTPEELADDAGAALQDLGGKGPALVVRSGGGRAGESFFPSAERTLIGRSPECDVFLDDVTVSRKHAELVRDGETLHDQRPRQPQRDVREQEADRDGRARGRRRAPDRQIPADLPAPMSTTTAAAERLAEQQRLHTIGAVCARLQPEFEDISISKIRYLEDQGLLTPKRTRGGYRLFSEEDVERLETILRLQRDEFLPLRVIRQELASGAGRRGAQAAASRRPRRAGGRAGPRGALRARRHRRGAGAGAGGVRPAHTPHRGRRAALPRRRRGDRRRVRAARPVRDRRPAPAHLPQLGRPRGGAAGAARRAGAPGAQPRASQGRARRPAGARRGVAGALAASLLA